MDLIKEMSRGMQIPDRRVEAKKLVEKWGRTGLLEGLDSQQASTVARLMEGNLSSLDCKCDWGEIW